ncbi:PREDICTED: uncharacterized protein LOC105359791 [Ceratosolen solmsi marchali]|uniref:Uncharacterized protein LOC105359791 n=1 Tax=Ceratosolen solmsi marchali TaxID=326594 RepID=A0AAJ6VMN4_9HYME|nr:PREDICTED: uncharacterized protein LOC105359791 [Ceratosolen solmsi marchali]
MDISSINQHIRSNNLDKVSNNGNEQADTRMLNDIVESEVTEIKPSREKLKLDLSKIPQHNFRNITPPRRESPKSETPRSETPRNELPENSKFVQSNQSDDVNTEKLMENLPRAHNRAAVSGNKISTDKLLRNNKDTPVVKLKCQVSGPTTIERNDISKENGTASRIINNSSEVEVQTDVRETGETKISASLPKNRSSADDLVSPTEDTESFDSWSICSADINNTRGDLHSPTYSMYIRRDHPNTESVIDRIRRKSFYSRFNDRKRKASLNAPPPGINMSSSVTLPRKFSFHSARDISKDQKNNKTNNYTLPSRKNPEKSYSMYNDDATLFRNSPIERDRYSDGGSSSSYSNDLKSPSESYGHISSSYDPLRKYLSPICNSSVARRKYHSSEFSTNNDLGSYRNSSSLADSMLEPSLNTNLSALPRRYGRNVSGFEPKTVEYYEELLAPNNTDYLRGRRLSPLPYDNYNNKFENGYHNGSIELPQINTDKWKSHSNKASRTDLTEGIQGDDCTRKLSQSLHERDDLSSNSLDQRATASTAE